MTNRTVCVTTALLLFCMSAFSQTTGTPPFSSLSGGPDVVNLANLNVHYSMPVFGRPGRGIPLLFALSVDSSVWTLTPPVFPSTLKTWVHSPTWGRSFGAIPAAGAVFYTVTQLTCPDPNGHYPYNQYTATTYLDANNTSHSFNVKVYDDPCTTNKPHTATSAATDGSNATMAFTCCATATVTTQDGEVAQPLVLDSAMNVSNSGPYTDTDSNGNRLTINARAAGSFLLGSIVDTLGTIGVSSTGTPPSPVNYTYTSPSGTTVSVVATYVTMNVQLSFGCSGTSGFGPQSTTLLDRITLPDGSFYKFTYEPTTIGSSNVTGRIASVKFPTGGTIAYSYMGGDNNRGIFCSDGSTAGFNRITPDGTWQYRRTAGGTSTSFTTTVTDPQGKTTLIAFSGNYETQRQVYDGGVSGTLLSNVITCYNANTMGCETATVTGPPFSQVTTRRSLNGGLEAKTDVKYTINPITFLSLMTETDEYDFGGSLTRKTTIAYDPTLGNNIVDKPLTVTVENGSGVLAAKTEYTYDEDQGALQPSGAAQRVAITCTSGFTKCRGNLTALKRYKTTSATLTQTFTHYDTGQVYQATDPNGAVTTNTYGTCGNSLLTNVSTPLSLSRSFTWNCTGGVSTSTTDENNKATTFGYNDSFWRVTSSTDPLSNATNYSYSTTTASSALTFGASTVESLTTLDSLGRQKLTQRRQAPGSSNWDSVSKSYDSNGRPFRVTMPCSAAAGTVCPTTPSTTTTYDALNRPLLVTDGGGGTISYSYSVNDVLVTRGPAPANENSKRRQMEYDVCEISNSTGSGDCGQGATPTGFLTQYTYNTLGLLTNVTQNAQGTSQGRTYMYDMLGRLTSESNPESGTTSYFYDSSSPCAASSGDLVKKSDGNGNSICYSYDSLHRLTAKTYSGTNVVNQQGNSYYVYDSATVNGVVMSNAKARLAEAYTAASPTGTKITDLGFSYTARGEQATLLESTPHSGGYYTLSLTYWPSGALNTLAGLGLPTISYNSDGEGRPTAVSASSGQNPVTGTSYNVSGQVTGVTLGSGDVANFGFDANTGRQNFYNEVINGSVVSGSMTWNPNGTAKQFVVSDAFNATDSQTCNYVYDDIVRISSANCGGVWSQTFTYDPFGNITKSGSSNWMPGYNTATNRYTLGGTTYDANGNLLTDTFHTYKWNVENRPTSFDTITLIHDALGRIVEKNNSGVYNQYVYDPSGLKLATMSGPALFKALVSLPGGIQAVFSPTAAFYRVPDWLGSSRVISSSTRTYNTSEAFAPFGERYALGGSAPFVDSFTGLTNSTVSDEYDFPARSLHPGQGRWISPDPAGLGAVDPSNPQTWNRYAYVGNNPTGTVDPLGLLARQIECVSCNLNGGLGCILTFSCVVFTDSFGMQIDSKVALQQLHNGSGVICQQCAGHPNWVVGANNDIYDVEAYQRFGSTYNLSTGIASPPTFLGWRLTFGKVGQVSGDLPIGLDFINCPNGCRQIWQNTNGAANTIFYATGAVLTIPAIVAVPGAVTTASISIAATAETYGVPATAISAWTIQNWNKLMNYRKIGLWIYSECQTHGPC